MAGHGLPRVLILTTGGTITMGQGPGGGLGPVDHAPGVVSRVPELGTVATLDCVSLANQDSSDVQPSFWVEIARAIYERYREFDGFVVTHGTDTMALSAAAVSFLLQELGKPIVFTGAQVPFGQVGSDGRTNIVNAVRVATSDLAEVCIVFGSQVIRGCRARKVSAFALEAFESIGELAIGTIGLSLRLAPHARRRSTVRRPLLVPAMRKEVARISVWPGIDPEVVRYLAHTHAGLVISGFGVGTLPSGPKASLLPVIAEATARGVPVVVTTQCAVGSTAMELYEVGRGALEAGAIPGMDMIREVALVKLMWALGQTDDAKTVESIMLKDYVGEIRLSLD